MANEISIPALPCASIIETANFYVALGFEITYQQERPNNYAVVKYEDFELHLFSMKGYEPANSYSTCLVIVDDATALHKTFKESLKAQLGKVPVAGIPRLTRPSNNNSAGDWRFNVIDPGGNYIRFIERDSQADSSKSSNQITSKASRSIRAATLLLDAKSDFAGAAQMLDKLVNAEDDLQASELVQAMSLRAEAAANLGDHTLAESLLREISKITLDENEKLALSEILQRADELRAML